MGNLFESLKDYFEKTPKEILDNDWKEIEYLNDIGPDVIEYVEYVKKVFGVDLLYSSSAKRLNARKFDISEISDTDKIAVDSQYYLAA
jgi:hypothetical protein